MRCPQGGGLTAERRVFREHIRMQTAELFALGHDNAAVAKQLRVSVRSVQRWHQAWEHGGTSAHRARPPARRPRHGHRPPPRSSGRPVRYVRRPADRRGPRRHPADAITDLMARRLTAEATISWRDPTTRDQPRVPG
ncbi:helix-turn-helix domain-containing protein [Streptomyces sp. NPDC050619]|uniref:helix-turn-helix domain-containing protein n=1 Tax=Streptomyces sp. NPDC050619 TaxID=3157214 RepID=UPI00343F278D